MTEKDIERIATTLERVTVNLRDVVDAFIVDHDRLQERLTEKEKSESDRKKVQFN